MRNIFVFNSLPPGDLQQGRKTQTTQSRIKARR